MSEPTPERREAIRGRLAKLAWALDARVEVAGVRVGLDALLGLVPGVGDAASALISLYIIHEAGRLGASKRKRVVMLGRLLVDFVGGSVPVAGDVFDVFYRANVKNLRSIGIEPWRPGREGREQRTQSQASRG